MRVALGQINTVVGNFAANLAKVRDVVARARGAGAEVVVFPELALSGYPPMDLLERASFLRDQREALDALIPESRDLAIVAGLIMPASKGQAKSIVNAAVALVDGQIAHVQAKSLLPTYDVFDEWRYFQPAESRQLWSYRGRRIGLAICEDVW
ncbi:MAG: NAD+ synthase, partial [Deltaproteobacteria bacterium]|nr:NAD+ synthase [Deltaproteobacteria bacterium]